MIFNMIAAGGGSGGRPMAYGTINGASGTGASVASGSLTISGLPFRPVIFFFFSKSYTDGYQFARYYNEEESVWMVYSENSGTTEHDNTSNSSYVFSKAQAITDTGVVLKKTGFSGDEGIATTGMKYWYAFGPES